MCRLLAIKSHNNIDIQSHFKHFANIAKESKEYQGHGWGMAWWTDGKWKTYHNINPIWEDDLHQVPQTKLVLFHARSAYQNEGIVIENNMPFISGNRAFIFNGELQGVRINVEGKIGAEKILNFILRFNRNGINYAIDRALPIIEQRTDYIRAMNFVLAEGERLFVSNYFNEDGAYFNLFKGVSDNLLIISSQTYGENISWQPLNNYNMEVF